MGQKKQSNDFKKTELKALKARRKELVDKYGERGQRHNYGSVMGGLNPASLELDKVRSKIKKLEAEIKKEKPGNQIISTTRKNNSLYEVQTKEFTAHIGKSDKIFFIIKDGRIQKGDYKTLGEAKKAILNKT
jgi:transposase